MHNSRLHTRIWLLLLSLLFAAIAGAQTTSDQPSEHSPQSSSGGTQDLQKATQNPVSSLISVPVQNNSNFGIGPFNRTQDILNIQPVIPLKASNSVSLIIRWITPIIWQPAPGTANLESLGIEEDTPVFLLAQSAQKSAGVFGFGDMNPTFFLSPAKPGKIIWGVGPAFVIPTATSRFLGQGKFSVGPSFVALVQPGHWTIGVLANNVWSVAGPSDRIGVNQMTLQYFINYNLKKGWFLSMSPIVTANWKASSGNMWTVPVGGGIGRIFKLGLQPVNISAQFYENSMHPMNGSPWGMRLQMAFLFPKLPPAMKEKLKELEQKK